MPEHVHRTPKARAALRSQTLSDDVRGELERSAARPSPDELLAMPDHGAAALGRSSAADVRRSRDRAS